MKKRTLTGILAIILSLLVGCGTEATVVDEFLPEAAAGSKISHEEAVARVAELLGEELSEEPEEDDALESSEEDNETEADISVETMIRPAFIDDVLDSGVGEYTPIVEAYEVENLSDLDNYDRIYLQEAQEEFLKDNLFVVEASGFNEFYEKYEDNRYFQEPSFITTDSMMHTYHLYFSMLQKKTERDYLYDLVESFTEDLLDESIYQYEDLYGTEWEEAALRNVAFFNVAQCLISGSDDIYEDAEDIVEEELANIMANGEVAIVESTLTNEYEDYTQYIPRGYYEGDELLEKYFRTMMWYGRRNFSRNNESLNRSALLMTLAMSEGAIDDWDTVYTVTSFFAGSSDDAGYYEYLPIIKAAYGDDVTIDDLADNDEAFETYTELTANVEVPKINSVPFDDDDGETDKMERALGYRFMGQRFSIDEATFAQLTYSKVKENESKEKRLLPDALDLPAALGSQTAYDIMEEQGNIDYPNYDEQLDMVSETIEESPELWFGSLYASWLKTLTPMLEEKGDGYPSFMTSELWNKKNLESFLGSYTELKHDTILYSKQMMAEMGGGDEEVLDDRGYVEPEPEVFGYLASLTELTEEGLDLYGVISDEDAEGLETIGELAQSLSDIALKELTGEEITEDEYELIRSYGGSLEHLWNEVIKEQTGEEYNYSEEHPAALVADIATDPNGSVLEEGIGSLDTIYVVVPVDGSLRIASGCVFNYYQFEWPIEDRLTDSKWRQMLGLELDEDGNWIERDLHYDLKPDWAEEYRVNPVYDYE